MNNENMNAATGGGLDNLEELEGIGPGYAKALYEIGVRRFADLSQFKDPEQLRQALLDQTGTDVPLGKIEKGDWIGQANILATNHPSNIDRPLPAEVSASDLMMVSEVHDRTVVPQEETQIEIADLEISEIGPSAGVPEKQILTQVRFRISGSTAYRHAAHSLPFRVEVHIVDMENGISSLVASGLGHLEPQVHEYMRQHLFAVPEVGRYRLYCITLLLPPGHLAAYREGPVINIAP